MTEDFAAARAPGTAQPPLWTATPRAETSLLWQASFASRTPTKPHANQEIHPAEPAGWNRDGVPGRNCWAVKIRKPAGMPPHSYLLSIIAKEVREVKKLLRERVSFRVGNKMVGVLDAVAGALSKPMHLLESEHFLTGACYVAPRWGESVVP